MIERAWTVKSEQLSAIKDTLRKDIDALNGQIDGLLNRIIDSAPSSAAMRAYERKIAELEKKKLLMDENLRG